MTARTHGFTGRHMLFVTSAFFAVVIGVNVTMAWLASSSWSGLVVENTYVASQEFNKKAAAIKALAATGISGSISMSHGVFHYHLKNRDGSPAAADIVVANFKRPVGDHEDFNISLEKAGEGSFTSSRHVPSGDWIVELISRRGDAVVMHEAVRFDTAGFGQ